MLLIGITQTEIIRHLESVGGKRKKAPHMRCLLFVGAGDGARTRYLHLGKVALYQMSYARGTKLSITDFSCLSTLF